LTHVKLLRQEVPSLRIAVVAADAMRFNFHPLRNVCLEPLSTRDAGLLLTYAQTLQRLADAGQGQLLLRGKNLGLLCESDEHEEARRFRRAATDLGARVAHIRPDLSASSSPADIAETGRMLGRLYDGIECLGMEAEVVKRLGAAANVPAYDGLASPNHPTAKLVEQLGTGRPFDERHRFMVQAVLLSTLN
jgi:ornithine carbamoyltransferase